MNWATEFCLICHIHLTSRQHTTTFSSISTTFCRDNASECAADPETDWHRLGPGGWRALEKKKKVDRKHDGCLREKIRDIVKSNSRRQKSS